MWSDGTRINDIIVSQKKRKEKKKELTILYDNVLFVVHIGIGMKVGA